YTRLRPTQAGHPLSSEWRAGTELQYRATGTQDWGSGGLHFQVYDSGARGCGTDGHSTWCGLLQRPSNLAQERGCCRVRNRRDWENHKHNNSVNLFFCVTFETSQP
ncbi:hypothetical protein GBAR_LOCUS27070, partial [Geodia barretti]